MIATAASNGNTTWGDWALGDLADSLQLVSTLLGPTADVASIHLVSPSPSAGECMPRVTVTARNQRQLDDLKHAAANGEFDYDYICRPNQKYWAAALAGIYLVLTLEGGQR